MDCEFLYNPPGVGPQCHAPSLLESRAGWLLASWYAYPEVEHRNATLILARCRPGSRHWEASVPLLGPFASSPGNPVLFQEPGGRIWLIFVLLKGDYWTSAELHGAWSDDEGATWSRERLAYEARGTMVRHPPVRTVDGASLLPVYDERLRQAFLLERAADAETWREAFRFHDPPLLQPVLVDDDAGRLTLLFRPWSDPRQIWRSQSVDGRCWSAPIRTPLPCPLSGIAAFALPGRLAAVYNHTEEHRRHPLSLSLSRDGGVSWEAPWHFETVRHEVSYPQFHARADGRAHGVYGYNRRLIKYVAFESGELA